ncbi:hypothetical protein PLCT2_02525 [Planctomycetaceae bacterium]|nr:hypothetical protein PLCT2_02525 [Planctomycetaceae bacterium]
MKRVIMMAAASSMLLLAGCNADGLEFNGAQQVEQFPVRKIPVVHYQLPSEVPGPGGAGFVVDEQTMINLTGATFVEQGPASYDLWGMVMSSGGCTDNPTCSTPAPIPDWNNYTHDVYKTPGPGWKGQAVIEAYCLSFQNQWFLRAVDGQKIVPAVAGQAPVKYEGYDFDSLAISIHEVAQAVSPFSQTLGFTPAYAAQQEIGDPATVDANNVPRVQTPVNNVVQFQFYGVGAPSGLQAAGWREKPAENTHIETNAGQLQKVPVPDYFGGGGGIDAGGGVYMGRFSDMWQLVTSGPNAKVNSEDTVTYSYYLAAIGVHVIGYGVGLVDSSFALPGVVNNQEDMMNLAVVFDLSAFVAAGKQFQFVVEDVLRMQDVLNGTFSAPGPKSTLPGPGRP